MGEIEPTNLEQLKKDFPNIVVSPLIPTSPITPRYNCIAWAYGISNKRFWPCDNYYWPPTIKREATLGSFIQLFSEIGYKICKDGNLKEGHEKIAIYCLGINPTHAARQLESGLWSSKLGNNHDVSHTIESLKDSPLYGNVQAYMERKRS